MSSPTIRFSAPFLTGRESLYLDQVLKSPVWHGDGEFTERATTLLTQRMGVPALLTPSCTHALELAALLLNLGPGDEVICPAFTFPSTADAIALRGATPVFVDVDPATLNLDPQLAELAVTTQTRAVLVVHYGGVAADIEGLLALCARYDLVLVEDNAHGLGATWRDRRLGTFGSLSAQSFHDTKNVTSGEGGALLFNDATLLERAEVIREKGTNRARFLRGEVDKYTWVDVGSSYLPSELQAAVLVAQLEAFDEIQGRRQRVWAAYAERLPDWAGERGIQAMAVPAGCQQPAHLYYLVLPTLAARTAFIAHLWERGIVAAFHYQSLATSPAGRRVGRTPDPCVQTDRAADQLVRLPLHASLSDDDVDRVVVAVTSFELSR